jgi:valyl-tRNA synthetase
LLNDNADSIKRLARVAEITMHDTLPEIPNASRGVVGGVDLLVPLEGLIDVEKEIARIRKEIAKREGEAQGLAGRLGNASFVDRAPAEVVQQARDRHAELLSEIEKLQSSLSAFGK